MDIVEKAAKSAWILYEVDFAWSTAGCQTFQQQIKSEI